MHLTALAHAHDPHANRFVVFLDRAEDIRIRHVVAGAIELGKAALEELYDGDFQRFHDRSAAQADPLSHLLQYHADRLAFLRLTIEHVRRCILAYEVDHHLPTDARGKLNPSQLRALAAIPEAQDRAQLASQALHHKWSVEQTEQHVTDLRRALGLAGKGGGRKPLPEVVKRASAVSRTALTLGPPADVGALPVAHRAQIRRELEQVRDLVHAWLHELK